MWQLHWLPNVTKCTCLEKETANVSSKYGVLKNDMKRKAYWNLTLFCFCAQLKYNTSLFSILTEYFQLFQGCSQHGSTCPLLKRTHNIDLCPGFIAGPQMNLEIKKLIQWITSEPTWMCQCFLHPCQKCTARSSQRIDFQSLRHLRWLTDWADFVLPPPSISPVTEHLLSPDLAV